MIICSGFYKKPHLGLNHLLDHILVSIPVSQASVKLLSLHDYYPRCPLSNCSIWYIQLQLICFSEFLWMKLSTEIYVFTIFSLYLNLFQINYFMNYAKQILYSELLYCYLPLDSKLVYTLISSTCKNQIAVSLSTCKI